LATVSGRRTIAPVYEAAAACSSVPSVAASSAHVPNAASPRTGLRHGASTTVPGAGSTGIGIAS
jgi:hypothetical protein